MKKSFLVICALLLMLITACCAAEDADQVLGTCTFEDYCYVCGYESENISGEYTSTRHRWTCPDCGHLHDSYHEADCNAPDTCTECGAAGVDATRVYCTRNEVIQYTATQHWSICADCGRVMDPPYEHWSDCTEPDKCYYCERTDVIISPDTLVHYESEYTKESDETMHWWKCDGCGEKLTPEPHERYCYEDACMICDRSDVTIDIVTHKSWNSFYAAVSDTLCGTYCTDCGELVSTSVHKGYCDDPDLCTYCDTDGVTLTTVWHKGNYTYKHDNTHHWRACEDCGEEFSREPHYTRCGEPDSCIVCEADGLTSEIVDHEWDLVVSAHDNTHCYSLCICGEKFDMTRHFTTDCTKPDKCENCGGEGVDCILYHSYEAFDSSSGHFYIGVAEHDADGHWWKCADCGDESRHDHSFSENNLCVACGYQPETRCEHPESGWVRKSNDSEYSHFVFCGSCGAQMYIETEQEGPSPYEYHTATCAEPDVCVLCGDEDIYAEFIRHSEKTKFCWDATTHWLACADCGGNIDVSSVALHTPGKDDPTVCADCGATDIRSACEHTGETRFESDNYHHWWLCADCGQLVPKDGQTIFPHVTSCTDRYTCTICGKNNDYIFDCDYVHGTETKLVWDDVAHGTGCADCGKFIDESTAVPHTAYCGTSYVCIDCGAANITAEIKCTKEQKWFRDTEKHWQACEDCNTFVADEDKLPHELDAEGACTVCGLEACEHPYDKSTYLPLDKDSHQIICGLCNTLKYTGDHSAVCTAPGTCLNCGDTDITAPWPEHNPEEEYTYDAYYHWTACADCGEAIYSEGYIFYGHTASCDDPTFCVDCGAKDVHIESLEHASIDHEYGGFDEWYDTEYKYDQTSCWSACVSCGEVKYSVHPHGVYCTDDPGKCMYCDQTDVTIEVVHWHTSYQPYNAMMCEKYCSDCESFIGGRQYHEAACSNPTRCIHCKAEGDDYEINHNFGEYAHDDTHHWIVCSGCGKTGERIRHHAWRTCIETGPAWCFECEAEDIDATNSHSYECYDDGIHSFRGPVFSSEEGHWWHCAYCGDETVYDHELNDDGVCKHCGHVPCEHPQKEQEYVKLSKDEHQRVCTLCSTVLYTDDHYANCTAPTTCADCGAEDIVPSWTDHNAEDKYTYDKYYHWHACADCGIPVGNGENVHPVFGHEASCDDPTVCVYCDAKDVHMELIEHASADPVYGFDEWYDGEYKYNQTTHWYACVGCGEAKYTPDVHTAYCTDDTGVCLYCGAKDVLLSVSHDGTKYVSISSTECQKVCEHCLTPVDEPRAHSINCNKPGVCEYCDASNVTGTVYHVGGHADEYTYNDTHHWLPCESCGEPVEGTTWGCIGEHVADCQDPTVCVACGATGVTMTLDHDWGSTFGHNDTHCWRLCPDCGEAAHEPWEHEAHDCTKPDTCSECGTSGVTCVVFHDHHYFDDGIYYHVGPVFSSAEGHWWHCTACGDETIYPHEYGGGGVCEECGYSGRIIGDANDDGAFTMEDLILVLQHGEDPAVLIKQDNADVNNDDAVDVLDILLLLQHSAGWDVELK